MGIEIKSGAQLAAGHLQNYSFHPCRSCETLTIKEQIFADVLPSGNFVSGRIW